MLTRRSQRRRRVIYNVHNGGATDFPNRRQTEQLRRARKPIAVYGERVKRRLDARWFSAVPVRRKSMTVMAASLIAVAAVLTLAHAATELSAWLKIRPELARPLQIGRADSIASYIIAMTWTATGGLALLVYQIRRYRLDDYRGQYRLWRTVVVTSILLGLNQIVGAISWLGHWTEAVFGQRIGLSGANWIRLLISMAMAILILRLVIDTRRSRVALAAVLAAGLMALLPETVRWNLWTIESPGAWVAITAAPLWTAALGCIAVTGYLRTVYREVLEVDDTISLNISLPTMPRLFTRKRGENRESEQTEDASPATTSIKPRADQSAKPKTDDKPAAPVGDQVDDPPSDQSDDSSGERSQPPKPGWFAKFKRRNKNDATIDPASEQSVPTPPKKPAEKPAEKPVPDQPTPPSVEPDLDDSNPPPSGGKKRRFGLSRFLKARSTETDDVPDDQDDDGGHRSRSNHPPANAAAAENHTNDDGQKNAPRGDVNDPSSSHGQSQDGTDQDEWLDENEIDWDSLSKSERRRLRKQIKRQGRAA